jgi:hypothetical protein
MENHFFHISNPHLIPAISLISLLSFLLFSLRQFSYIFTAECHNFARFTCTKTTTSWNNIMHIRTQSQTWYLPNRGLAMKAQIEIFIIWHISFWVWHFHSLIFLFQTLWTYCERCEEQVNCNKVQLEAVPLWITFCYLIVLISNHCPAWHSLLYFEIGMSPILLNINFSPTYHVIENFGPDAVPVELFWLYFAYHIPQCF